MSTVRHRRTTIRATRRALVRAVTIAGLGVTAIGLAAGTASADPTDGPEDSAPGIVSADQAPVPADNAAGIADAGSAVGPAANSDTMNSQSPSDRQGRGITDYIPGLWPSQTRGIEMPDATHPGAAFGKGTYNEIATKPIDDYLNLSDQVLAKDATKGTPERQQNVTALQRSFSSDGCTSSPDYAACRQHDFRYIVGPNVYANDPAGATADRTAADNQLGANIGKESSLGSFTGGIYRNGTNWFGKSHYQPTPTTGPTYNSVDEILKAR